MINAGDLPHVDSQEVEVATYVEQTWSALLTVIERSLSQPFSARYARLVRCEPVNSSGPRPLSTGSTLPGFLVASAVPRSDLVLVGRHRFSTYALILSLHGAGEGRTVLRAETRATFPGRAGRVYWALVIGSRGHVLVLRRLLAAVRRRAEGTVDPAAGT